MQNLGPVFDDDTADVDVEHLPALEANILILAGRQAALVDFQDVGFIGIGDLGERRTHATGLTAGFVGAEFGFREAPSCDVECGGASGLCAEETALS